MTASTGATKPPRFPQLTMEQLNPAQRTLAEKIMTFSRVGISGPYNIMLRSPKLLARMLDLLDYLRWNSSVPLHLNEFAILIVGRRWRSQIEWYAHVPIALKAGLSQSIIDQLKQKKRPEGMKDDEAIVYDFCTELCGDPRGV
jgi:4-carboxymuconolactone decarboxylase